MFSAHCSRPSVEPGPAWRRNSVTGEMSAPLVTDAVAWVGGVQKRERWSQRAWRKQSAETHGKEDVPS